MKRATIVVLLLAALAAAQEKPVPEKGEAIARLAVPGMSCEGACPPTVKGALQGEGVKDVSVDFAKKTATLRFDPDKTRAAEALARLVRMKAYASSSVASLEALFDGDFAKATASVDVKKKGGRARLHLLLEPKPGHTLATAKASPDVEIELVALPAGLKSKEPLVKWKGGLKAAKAFELDVEVDSKARSGETELTVEVRTDDVTAAGARARVISLVVPVLVP